MRKKQFHKEAIKVELISSGEQVESNKSWSSDLFKWDPISSGEGDLLLEDLAKSFTASSEVSKTAKAIDFTSIIGSLPSHGFQVKDLISGPEVASKSQDNSNNVNLVAEATAFTVSRDGDLEEQNRLDLPKPGLTSIYEGPSKQQAFANQNSQILYSSSGTTEVLVDAAEIGAARTTMEAKTINLSPSIVNIDLIGTQTHDLQSQNCELQVDLSNENVMHKYEVVDYDFRVDPKEETSTSLKDIDLLVLKEEENLRNLNAAQEAIGDLMDEDLTNQETSFPSNNLALHEMSTEKEQCKDSGLDPLVITGFVPIQESNAVTVEDNASDANSEPPDVTMENHKHEKTDDEHTHLTSVQSMPGIFSLRSRNFS